MKIKIKRSIKMNLRAPIFVLAILLNKLIISCSNGQSPKNANAAPSTKPITYKEWKEEAKTNIRLLSKYGNLPKTERQKELTLN